MTIAIPAAARLRWRAVGASSASRSRRARSRISTNLAGWRFLALPVQRPTSRISFSNSSGTGSGRKSRICRVRRSTRRTMSASVALVLDVATEVEDTPGQRNARRRRRAFGLATRSDGFGLELEGVLVGLFGDLQPDEQAGEDDERNDDQGTQRDAERDGDGLEGLHAFSFLMFGYRAVTCRRRTSRRTWPAGFGGGAPGR